jgi:hypothetical protein
LSASTERRRKPRAPLDSDAIVKIGNDSLPCRTLNVAVRGIALSCPQQMQPGSTMRVEFKLPTQREWISVDGVLVRGEMRRGRPVWGIEFKDVNYRTVGQIERYVREYLVTEARERYQRRQSNIVQSRQPRPRNNITAPPRRKPVQSQTDAPKGQYAIDSKDLKSIYRAAIKDLEKK